MQEKDYSGMVRRLPRPLWEMIRDIQCDTRDLKAREIMTRAEQPLSHSALLLDGILARDVRNEFSGARQLVAIQVPGDFVDLHSLPLGSLDHDVVAMSDAQVALFRYEDLKEIMSRDEDHAQALWSLTMIVASINRHWTFRMGTMRALACMANFLCEMHLRLTLCNRQKDGQFVLPWTQVELGQICGISSVHVSRVLKDLREAGLATVRAGEATMHDRENAANIGNFDPKCRFLPRDGNRSKEESGVASPRFVAPPAD